MSEPIDNRADRIRKLKHIITRLHEGAAPDEVKAELTAIVRETDATEIAQMEEELIAEGMTVEEVRSMCDLHAQVLREIMAAPKRKEIPPGHPVDTFRRENEALSTAVNEMRAAIAEIEKLPDAARADDALVARLRQAFNDLMDVDKHYQRKEHLVFSCLERHDVTGPPKVMWAKDDEARELLKALSAALAKPHTTAADWKRVAAEHAGPALNAVSEMIFKEENILFPMALETLTDNEWAEIWSQSAEYGWCLVEPREGYMPTRAAEPAGVGEARQRGRPSSSLPASSTSISSARSSTSYPWTSPSWTPTTGSRTSRRGATAFSLAAKPSSAARSSTATRLRASPSSSRSLPTSAPAAATSPSSGSSSTKDYPHPLLRRARRTGRLPRHPRSHPGCHSRPHAHRRTPPLAVRLTRRLTIRDRALRARASSRASARHPFSCLTQRRQRGKRPPHSVTRPRWFPEGRSQSGVKVIWY